VLLLQQRSLLAEPLDPLSSFQVLLSLLLQLFLQVSTFFAQERKPGLLFAKMLQAVLGQPYGLPCIPYDESGDDKGCSANYEESADANEK
jgi:hypothetical protein